MYDTIRFKNMSVKNATRRLLGEKAYRGLTFYYRNPERAAQDAIREVTSALRVLPDFVIVGAMKSGTTSLFHYLASHPQVVPPQYKEIHFFDNAYRKGVDWYRRHFPLRATMKLKSNSITGESSPYYMLHPRAPKRMYDVIPDAKLIFLLRDPVERAISHYFFMRRFGEEERGLMRAVKEDRGRIEKDGLSLKKGDVYRSYKHQFFSYVQKGKYYEQIKRYEEKFGNEKIKLVKSKELFEKTEEVFGEVLRFLKLDDTESVEFEERNKGGNKKPISDETKEELKKEFEESNRKLKKEFGISF